jgi:hypothetical protein
MFPSFQNEMDSSIALSGVISVPLQENFCPIEIFPIVENSCPIEPNLVQLVSKSKRKFLIFVPITISSMFINDQLSSDLIRSIISIKGSTSRFGVLFDVSMVYSNVIISVLRLRNRYMSDW